jgi:glycerophosphoryl diester phosphodiesterase
MRAILLVVALAGCNSLARKPIVIAHRGASGSRPEHTLAAYQLAIEQGADFIEPDLVVTRDGVLIARHENEIGATTNVSALARYADRKTTKTIDGEQVTGWFAEDFTLAEIKQLRARERIPGTRPDNAKYDDRFEIPTFAEVIDLAQRADRPVGIYPETKHPTYFRETVGVSLGELVVRELVRLGFTDRDRVYIQSFEVGNLLELKRTIMPAHGVEFPLVQLFGASGPYDFRHGAHHDYGGLADLVAITADTSYTDLATPAVLRWMAATYATGCGPSKRAVLADPALAVRMIDAGLLVHPWTLRLEEPDYDEEIRRLLALGVHGFFTDQPREGVAARDRFFRP